eukprot:128218-Chlamydomonas_euryale.AAC.1
MWGELLEGVWTILMGNVRGGAAMAPCECVCTTSIVHSKHYSTMLVLVPHRSPVGPLTHRPPARPLIHPVRPLTPYQCDHTTPYQCDHTTPY